MAELFSDLDKRMDARADDFEKKEDDPAFGGFHRIEKALFADKSTAGMASLADQLMHDVLELQSRIGALVIPPNKMVGGAASLIEEKWPRPRSAARKIATAARIYGTSRPTWMARKRSSIWCVR